jgi:hypothetical protein
VSLPGRTISNARRLADPRTSAREARSNPAPTIILIFVTLVAIQGFRQVQAGQPGLPTARGAFAYAGAAIAFVILATVAPDLVTYSLGLALLLAFLVNATMLEQLAGSAVSQLGALYPTGAGPRGGR